MAESEKVKYQKQLAEVGEAESVSLTEFPWQSTDSNPVLRDPSLALTSTISQVFSLC